MNTVHKSVIYNVMRRLFYTFTLGLVIFVTVCTAQMRGIWICSGELPNRDAVNACLSECSLLGFTDVFLQVRTAGDAAYKSATEPFPGKKEKDLDVLELACAQGHKLGLRIHAWLNVNYCAPGPGLPVSAQHVARRHPEWISCARDGRSMVALKKPEMRSLDSEGLYLSPDAEGLSTYFQGVIEELLSKYPVDGIHLDFIRYANYRFGYHGRLAGLFETRYFVDPCISAYDKGLCSDSSRDDLEIWRRIMNLRWMEMRADCLTGLVRSIRQAQVATRPDVVLSAAVWFPTTWAYSYVGQDWMRWLDEDLIDLAIPMAYAKSDQPLQDFLPNAKAYLESGKIAVGIGAWRLDGEGIIHKIEMVNKYTGGWVLFDYGGISKRIKVVSEVGDFITGEYKIAGEERTKLPCGWQMGWANRRPLFSIPRADEKEDCSADKTVEKNHYWQEAGKLREICSIAWGSNELLPGFIELAERILPWVDSCNRSLTATVRPSEDDLKTYFKKHKSEYETKKKRNRSKHKNEEEEFELVYLKNHDKVYRDFMLATIAKIIDNSTK